MSPFNATPLSVLLGDVNHPFHRASDVHRPKFAQPLYRTSSSAAGDTIEVELPGVDKSSASLSVKGETLHISAKRMMSISAAQFHGSRQDGGGIGKEASAKGLEKEPAEEDKVAVEYVVRFNVGKRADTERIEASMKNGLLSVVLPAKTPKEPEVRNITLG